MKVPEKKLRVVNTLELTPSKTEPNFPPASQAIIVKTFGQVSSTVLDRITSTLLDLTAK